MKGESRTGKNMEGETRTGKNMEGETRTGKNMEGETRTAACAEEIQRYCSAPRAALWSGYNIHKICSV
ncbi:hypothetical protein ElyMa_006985300 [Elysia marginata]|uniref:Uncharacterized protein n=1 Tax=Elysia marginata TaxID=1093978 RepID=A0AAV4JLS9_9GAST|nr:hypothetical protein ElyMa_006985300 [Elysia marginata]